MILKFSLSLLACLGLIALVWLLAPIVSVGEYQPLEPTWVRVLLSLFISLLIMGPLAMQVWRLRKAEHALKAGLTRQEEQSHAQSAKLQEIFSQAVGSIRQYQTRKAWYLGKPGLYEMPWYVMIGPPGSGKTTALKNAGLRFPLQGSFGSDAVRGVGGTRNCDWWFTDQAVLIDTAGRFTTQDSDQATDAAGWNSFLGLLKKYRPRQPINGVLLTLSIQDLTDTEARRQETASKIALRLQEILRTLGMCPPVYLLITKLDLLTGFNETFGRLTELERAQAWGINFPHPNELNTILKNDLPSALQDMAEHLGLLAHGRMQQEAQENRRHSLFEFPLAFAQLQSEIEKTVALIFQSGSPFERPVMLRGVYFTSGTQDNNLFDRIASATPGFSGLQAAQQRQLPSQGKGFFIRDTLSKVVFAEQHLGGYVRKKALLEKSLYFGALAACCLTFGLISLGWWLSHDNNSQAIAQTIDRSKAVTELTSHSGSAAGEELEGLFSFLNALLAVAEPAPPQLSHHLGLNQAKKLEQAEKLAYQKALSENLMPLVATRLEAGLRRALNSDGELAYEELKAYLMVYTPGQFDAAALSEWVVLDWKKNLLAAYDPDLQKAAVQHLQAAIALGAPTELPKQNSELIQHAREIIGATPPEARLYRRMASFFQAESSEDFHLAGAVGPRSAALFSRPSGKPLTQGVDAFYTRKAYAQFFLPRLAEQAMQLNKEAAWVLGEARTENTSTAQETSTLMRQARQLYLRNYIDAWDTYLKDVQLQAPTQFEQAVELARQLASPQSPLKKFLEAVASNTALAGKLAQASDKAEDLANQKMKQGLPGPVVSMAGSEFKPVDFEAPLEQQVDEHFSNINSLFEGNPPAYSQVSALLNELYSQLAAVDSARKGKTAPPPGTSIESLRVAGGMLPEPARTIVGQLAGHGNVHGRVAERANLNADLRPLQEICQRTVANRYPVQVGSSLDVLTEDFIRFFGPAGLMDQFFSSRLASLADTGGRTWTMKPVSAGVAAPGSTSLVQFQHAARIRDVFFSGAKPVPRFDVEMRLVQASHEQEVFYLELDGDLKMFSRQFQPAQRITWGGHAPSSVLRVRVSEGAYKTFNGPWALFRLFDTAKIEPTESPEKFRARFQLDGKQFDFEVLANSAFNPLRLNELRQFRCPSNL